MEASVVGCRAPRVSRCTSSASRNSGSAVARSPFVNKSVPRLLMEASVFGCRLPRVSRRTFSASQYSGSAAARSPLALNSLPRLLMEPSVFGCRLPRVSRSTSSASRSSGSAAATCSDADCRASRAALPAPRGTAAQRRQGRPFPPFVCRGWRWRSACSGVDCRASRGTPPAPRGTAAQPRSTCPGPAAAQREYPRWSVCSDQSRARPVAVPSAARGSARRGTRPCTGRSGRLRPALGSRAATARGSGCGPTWRSRGRRTAARAGRRPCPPSTAGTSPPPPPRAHACVGSACAAPSLNLRLDEVHHLYYPPNVSGTPTLGLYQPRALCAVAPHLLPGLRCEEDFWRDFGLPPPGPLTLSPHACRQCVCGPPPLRASQSGVCKFFARKHENQAYKLRITWRCIRLAAARSPFCCNIA
eukprot:scaffold8276_cov62-Phaeocystis_antarctica.AAC.11